MLEDLRSEFNRRYTEERYGELLMRLDSRSGTGIQFRVAETPVFLPLSMLQEMAQAGSDLMQRLLAWPEYLAQAIRTIPLGYLVAGQPEDLREAHPNFLTADFALVAGPQGGLQPRLVEIQAFPSVFAYQALLHEEYREVYDLPDSLGSYLSGLDREDFWALFRSTVLGGHDPEHVVLTEVDPWHQKTLPDFLLTARHLGIRVVDIATLVAVGKKLHYGDANGRLVPIHRIYNRAIADEMMARKVELPFDLTDNWEVEWAGHPNWYFLVSKYSVPWLCSAEGVEGLPPGSAARSVVPPAVFLPEFLDGAGLDRLAAAGVELPSSRNQDAVYEELLLKPLFSFAGKGIQFSPTRRELESIPAAERSNFLLQQRMRFVPTIETPHGMTQAEIRILYLWPDRGRLTPALSLVRLGRGKMMGVDHNKNQQWVGASAAFWR